MSIKWYFLDEDHELRNETSSLKTMFSNLISNRTETENQITTCTLNNNIVETKIVFLEKENSHLQSEIQNKQDTIQKLLKDNIALVGLINTKLTLPTQNKTYFLKSVHNEKENKDLKLSRKIETSELISSSDTKMRDPERRKIETKGHVEMFV